MAAPLLIAHRGGAVEAPENTLAAFRYSLALGIRWFELDVQMSRDGALVVFHDETLDRTTNGDGPIGSLTLEDLRRLDAGSWFGSQYAGERIPTLREVLELCASEGAGYS
jgi:glycerophosphoryl diester phosphodiesterase